jgi:hypothetical protein
MGGRARFFVAEVACSSLQTGDEHMPTKKEKKPDIHLFKGTSHLIAHDEETAEGYVAKHGYRREPDPAIFPDWGKKKGEAKPVKDDEVEATPGDVEEKKSKPVAKKKAAKKKGR